MAKWAREAIGPAYLFLCLILGGSAQGIWQNMALQLLGLALIAWAAFQQSRRTTSGAAYQLQIIVLLAIALIAIQMVPLPASLWQHLGGRTLVAQGFRILGMDAPSTTLSLAPYRSLDSLLGLIPPIAIFVAIVNLKAYRFSWLAAALLLGTIAGVILGALQVTDGGTDSHWYWYPESSFGLATGFFANANHMASLLVCTLPFLAALLVSARSGGTQRKSAILIAVAASALLVVVGIALNQSAAVYGLTPPVLAASAALLLPQRSALRRWGGIATAVFLVAALATLTTTSVRGRAFADASSIQSRQEMLSTSAKAMADFLPWGSGLGSFESVYHLYEDSARVDNTYVSHAHNDYAELALETGVPGILLMIAFLAWWGRAAWKAWRDPNAGAYARAGSIASGAILVHSLVDFPLRTGAIGVVFAMSLAMLVERRAPITQSRSDLRPTRHVVVS